ncbi:hypothetical protein [Streptomyces zagrosensis]|uniref:Secreted protein n=1 Tax=Streptomyces zagrosensis TaxID=1042984 RepID=A0A7W9UXZ4_9ACTN|nr:hypothetical protein [Streptomyces zagrosensis]MBB5934846.1 hypothetical protein [Streptomyces zagrosensis]
MKQGMIKTLTVAAVCVAFAATAAGTASAAETGRETITKPIGEATALLSKAAAAQKTEKTAPPANTNGLRNLLGGASRR